jgi:pimeloyl-ACP methyl ester carboxylesterase
MQIVFLPATASDCERYGQPEADWPALRARLPHAECTLIRFDRMVWYTPRIRAEALRRMPNPSGAAGAVTLVGFSKSGCGALNLALDHPGLFRSVVVFDAPLANEDIRRFELSSFYADAQELRADVPLLRVRAGATFGATDLILVRGETFAEEMDLFFAALRDRNLDAVVPDGVRCPHHWNSGWILPALDLALGTTPGPTDPSRVTAAPMTHGKTSGHSERSEQSPGSSRDRRSFAAP